MFLSKLLNTKKAGGYLTASHSIHYDDTKDQYLENDSGLEYRLFNSFDDLYAYHAEGCRDPKYLVSVLIGSRNPGPGVHFFGNWSKEFIDEDEDGDSVYSFFMHPLVLTRVCELLDSD